MTHIQLFVLIAGILFAVAALGTLLSADSRFVTACWYAGWAVAAIGYATQ